MSGGPLVRAALRAGAIVIALVAAVDPAITSDRLGKPIVSVVAGDARRDSAEAGRVAAELEKAFTVIRGPLSIANASVVVGDRIPAAAAELAQPVFAVRAPHDGPGIAIESVDAPAVAPAAARVPVSAIVHARGSRGRTLDVTLRRGALVVDRITRSLTAADATIPVSLGYVPTAAGATRLRVNASVSGAADQASADLLVDVRDTRWAVLFFDPRPSWMSTFVRRAAERDGRFVVSSRIVTSRNVSANAGQPPARLDDLAALELFDAVVVGAPDALTERDVAGLDVFMRRRGGTVVLLLDRRASGPYERLAGVTSWVGDSSGKALSISPASGGDETMRAAEIAWPARLPDGAEAVAVARDGRDSAAKTPVIWRLPVGAGKLVASGALDAWRFRDRSVSTFDRFWQAVIADAASAAPPPVSVRIGTPVVAPGEEVEVTATVRDAMLTSVRPVRTSVGASFDADGTAPRVVRLIPDAVPGSFRGQFRAPADTGVYRMTVSASGARADAPFVVAMPVFRATPSDPALAGAWVASRGGRTFESSDDAALRSALLAAIHPAASAVTWHPMRSAWWILPFALLLGGEWWLRRQRGLK